MSGVEGTFRFTCESVMRVLRKERESLMAVLEAFVYDPIINWRLLTDENGNFISPSYTQDLHPNSPKAEPTNSEEVPETINRKALQVMARISSKLTGKDFGKETLDIPDQIERLIAQARSNENLCQCYIGWCPFW